MTDMTDRERYLQERRALKRALFKWHPDRNRSARAAKATRLILRLLDWLDRKHGGKR